MCERFPSGWWWERGWGRMREAFLTDVGRECVILGEGLLSGIYDMSGLSSGDVYDDAYVLNGRHLLAERMRSLLVSIVSVWT